MPATKECPLCGGTMTIREQQTIVSVRGNPNATPRKTREWICPDCDYFEEAEEENR
jgi:YgiT-type zinc finger domain-containing protein